MKQTKKKKTHILIVEDDDPEKELEFEIAFQLSLTISQRYKRLMELIKQNQNLLNSNERKKAPSIISRT